MEKVHLRKYVEEDLEDYFDLVNDQMVEKFLPSMYCNNVNVAKAILKRKIELNNNKLIFAIEETEIKRVIGEIALVMQDTTAEIEVIINSKYRGKGYAKEAFSQLLDILKEKQIDIKKIRALISKENLSSQTMFGNLSFEVKENEKETNFSEYEREI